MSHQKEALEAQGFSGALPEMMVDWAQHNGATSDQYNTAIIEALVANGASSGQAFNDTWKEFLAVQGFSGAFPESKEDFFNTDSGRIVLLKDSATDTDDVLLENHTISDINLGSYVWTKENLHPRYTINNEIALKTNADLPDDDKQNDYSIDMGETALTIEAKAQSISSGFPHIMTLIVRFIDIDNYVGVRWQQLAGSIEAIAITESVAGNVTDLADIVPLTFTPSYSQTQQIIKVKDDGTTITGYFADETPVSYATTRFNTATKVGLKNTYDPLATWDDVIVTRT